MKAMIDIGALARSLANKEFDEKYTNVLVYNEIYEKTDESGVMTMRPKYNALWNDIYGKWVLKIVNFEVIDEKTTL